MKPRSAKLIQETIVKLLFLFFSQCCVYKMSKVYLIRKVLWMRGCEPDPHVGIDARHCVQQVGEAQTTSFCSVSCLKTSAEVGQV